MLTTLNIDIQAMLVWLTLPFYDVCGLRSVAVNSVYKLHFFTFIIRICYILLYTILSPHDDMLALYVLWSCACPSVCLSVDRSRSSTKTAKHRIMQTTPCDISRTRLFVTENIGKIPMDLSPAGLQIGGGRFKSTIFDQSLATLQERYKLGIYMHSYRGRNSSLYRMVISLQDYHYRNYGLL